MTNRDPITDPRVGDELEFINGKTIIVSAVNDRGVFWYTYDADGNMICLFDCSLKEWRESHKGLHFRFSDVNDRRFIQGLTAQYPDE